MDSRRLKKVLIIKPSSLGDVIHALPVASALKADVPGVRVDWVIGKGYEELLEGNPDVDRLILFDRRMLKGAGGLGRLMSFVRELRRERYDAVIDLQGLLRSGLMTLACRSARKLGLADAREGSRYFYNETVTVPNVPMHAAERYMLVLAHLGVASPETSRFTITVSQEALWQAQAVLKDAGIAPGEPFIAMAPSARWTAKRWAAPNFIELAAKLKKSEAIKTIFVGSDSDREVFEGLMDGVPPGSTAFGRTTLKGLAALLGEASLLVTNDSGPMHMAAVVGTPVIAVFGPTDPRRTGPPGTGHTVVRADMECAPCFKKECDTLRCMESVSVEEVFDAVRRLLMEREG